LLLAIQTCPSSLEYRSRVRLCPTARTQEIVLPDDSGIFLEQEIIFSGVMDATVFYPGVLPENNSTLPAWGCG
jgi:hypothetical protein